MDCGTTSTGNVLALICSFILMVNADYHIGFNGPSPFSNPTNTLSNGDCCNLNCTECNITTLRYCFRDAGHPHSDTTSSCFLNVDRGNPTFFSVVASNTAPIMACYTDLFQIYIRVSHQSGDVPDFDPPFTNPLIDDIFIEVTDLPAALYEERVSLGTVPYEATGDFGRASLQLRVSALCARGYNGSDCNTFCQDVDGEVMCEQVYDCSTPTSAITPVTPSEGPVVNDNNNNNVVAIAVGATIGSILVLVIILVIVGVFVICIRRSRSKSSYEPGAHMHYPLASNRDSRPHSVTESQLKSRPKDFDSFSSESASTNSPGSVPVADMYATVNKTGTNKGLYTPPHVPKTNEYQAFNQPHDSSSDAESVHVYQNAIVLQEQKDFTDIETENTMQGHDQEGLVYADLDISRQQRTQITNRESMEELNGVGMSAHSSPIMDEDTNAEPFDNIEVTYTSVQH